MSATLKDINSLISGMLPTNEPFVVSNTSSFLDYSGFQATENCTNGTAEELEGEGNPSSPGLMVAFHSTVAAVILIGNLLVLIVISKRKDLQVRILLYFLKE